MCNSITEFTPAYVAADADVGVVKFTELVEQVRNINNLVDGISGVYTTDAATRATLIKKIKGRVTQALSYLKSNKAWKSNYKAAKMAADKLRGTRPPKSKLPPAPAPGEASAAQQKKRNQGEQAYVELAGHYKKFVAACTGAPGYAPPSLDISVGKLNELLSMLISLNGGLSAQESQLTKAQQDRQILFYDENGLAERFQLVKAAVKGQYGQSSAHYASVRKLTW